MQNFIYGLLITLCFPGIICAVNNTKPQIDQQQKGSFMTQATIAQNTFAVPTMIDVPLVFESQMLSEVAVVDNSDVVVPSTIITNTEYSPLHFTTEDSYANTSAQNMTDGDQDTFTEFPFTEDESIGNETIVSITDQNNNEKNIQEKVAVVSEKNTVNIDIISNRAFVTDSFTLIFDTHIAKPTHIRVASVDVSGKEHILLPEKFYSQDTIVFPEEKTNHYRITLKYRKPLRINEIVFNEKNAPQTIERSVRFIAQPQISYMIYYNTNNHVNLVQQESPSFNTKINVPIVHSVEVSNNPLYKKIDSDKDGVIDRDDNCVDVENADQIDKDSNGIGDACEDFDLDGIINVRDNCPDVPNKNQVDKDFDKIGDVCDAEESRFMEKYPWIPFTALILVFGIVVLLILKTLQKK